MLYGSSVEDVLNCFSLGLFVAAFLTVVMIVREVLPHLNEQDQARLRGWFWKSGHARRVGGALNTAWSEHYRLFPRSRKRMLFACLLIAASLSVLTYPLWLVLGRR